MLNKYARAFFTRVLTPFAALLLRLRVSPDAVTCSASTCLMTMRSSSGLMETDTG